MNSTKIYDSKINSTSDQTKNQLALDKPEMFILMRVGPRGFT